MLKKILKISAITAVILTSTNAYALSPKTMFEDGKRAFDLARFEESREILERYMETWPEDENYDEALYYFTISSAKTIDARTEEYRSKLGKDLQASIERLSKNLPKADIDAANAALKIAQNKNRPETWDELVTLKPGELKHYISRGWYPDPTLHAFKTIEFTNKWLANNTDIDAEMKSDIHLLKLSALWEIIRSPLVKESNKAKLEEIGCSNLDSTFRKTLKIAFDNGNPDQKRDTAIFGYHFDYFNNNKLNTDKAVKSSWLRYLQSRGIANQETWSPRCHQNYR